MTDGTGGGDADQARGTTPAGDALAGYDYQVDVSILLALDLMVGGKRTGELVLEPTSQEDIEAEMREPGAAPVTGSLAIDGYRLVVQAKLRNTDAWTLGSVRSLLHHGGRRRLSAADRLGSSDVRYLLVTSAGINRPANALRVNGAGLWPRVEDLPPAVTEILPVGAAGRVAVVAGWDEARLEFEIKRLLVERFRVPNARWADCREALRAEARTRIRGAGAGAWRREEVEGVIALHDGYLAVESEMESFVHPTNWPDLRRTMGLRHAALIVGQSGTGKTLATRKLFEELRSEIPGLAHVRIRQGPQQLRDDRTPTPVLYEIEDPWGRFALSADGQPWSEQLPGLLSRATHDRMVICTTRRDVLQSADVPHLVDSWIFPLEAEHYGRRERRLLFRNRVELLPRGMRLEAAQAESRALAELATPLEIQRFFDALLMSDREGGRDRSARVEDAIRRAHRDAIEQTVVEQVRAHRCAPAAAVLWALLKAFDRLPLQVVREVEAELAGRDPSMGDGVSPLIDFLIAARNLRIGEGEVSYHHPRVEAGIQRILVAHRVPVRRTLTLLVEILVAPDGPAMGWGRGAAARIVAALASQVDLAIPSSRSTASRIDGWLAEGLARADDTFEEMLGLAAKAGSPDSNQAELARYLLHRREGPFSWGYRSWSPPKKEEAWYARLRADPATKSLLEAFITRLLPSERDDHPPSLVADLERLSPDLAGAYLVAAEGIVDQGFVGGAPTLAEGALADLDGFERILDMAVAVLTPSERDERIAAETDLAIRNGVYNDDYAEHLSEGDDGHTAGVFLNAYVPRARTTVGWRRLADHPHRDHLLAPWLKCLLEAARTGRPDAEEVEGAFAAARGGPCEGDFWCVLARAWTPRYAGPLRRRILEGHTDERTRLDALACLVAHLPTDLPGMVEHLEHDGQAGRAVEIAVELAHVRLRCEDDDGLGVEKVLATLGLLPKAYAELARAELAIQADEPVTVSAGALQVLAAAGDVGERVRMLRIAVLDEDPCIDEDVRTVLEGTEDDATAVAALEVAIARDLPVIDEALRHRFAKVRAAALTAVGRRHGAPLSDDLLGLAEDTGSPVRRALVALLAEMPHDAHVPALLHLADDTWSSSSYQRDDEGHYPIARGAVEALRASVPLAPEQAEALHRKALATADQGLRLSMLELLARTAGLPTQESLLELVVAGGRGTVRRAAGEALLGAGGAVPSSVVERVDARMLQTQPPGVAAMLALLLACRGRPATVTTVARELAGHPRRRILLVLMVRDMALRDGGEARELARLLPDDHPAVSRALGVDGCDLDDDDVADLGDPATCAQVLRLLRRSWLR